jgi:hypothetical protein
MIARFETGAETHSKLLFHPGNINIGATASSKLCPLTGNLIARREPIAQRIDCPVSDSMACCIATACYGANALV